jgi:carbohydrate-selective porin OprB
LIDFTYSTSEPPLPASPAGLASLFMVLAISGTGRASQIATSIALDPGSPPVAEPSPAPLGVPPRFATGVASSGEWGGELGEDPLPWRFTGRLTTEALGVTGGGVERGRPRVGTLLEANFVPGPAWKSEHFDACLGLQAVGGAFASADAGALQCLSAIESPEDRFQLGVAWAEWRWHEARTRLRIGKQDGNDSFAEVPAAAEFLHSSMTLSPTLLGLPTYPDPGFGLVLEQRVGARHALRFGLFEGDVAYAEPIGSQSLGSFLGGTRSALALLQATTRWDGGRLSLGAWHHTAEFERFDGGSDDGAWGTWLVAEQRLSGSAASATRVDGFLQLGRAPSDVVSIDRHLGCGVACSGALLGGAFDEIGLGLCVGWASDAPGAALAPEAETAVECFVARDLGHGARLQPDLQWIHDPLLAPGAGDAWVLGLRWTLDF